MEDELNIDPRETDYLDDYDMQKAINFYELKMQLANIGYADPGLLASLRDHITANETGIFTISCQENEQDRELRTWFEYDQLASGDFTLRHYECLYSIEDQDINRLFTPDVTKSNALAVMHKDHIKGHDPRQIQRPLTLEQTINYLNINIMNTENLGYLQKQLLNLGFGEQMNEALEKQIKAKTPEFTLAATNEYNKQSVDYTLHFKKGDQNEMYFFNKYDASLPDKDMQQTFYINKGSGITAKEAYNLMDGRAVHKELENKEGEKYKAWITLDKDNKTENGNHKLNTFSEGWNYKPERAIDKMDIVGIGEEGARDKLMKSLEKGNRHQVEAIRDGKTVKVFLEANPAEHRVNITNYKGEPQQLEHYKKPEVKQEQKKAETQTQEESKKKSRGKKMSV